MSVFRHARLLTASPAQVYGAFQDPVRLARWWGPEGFRNTFHTFDFREGGDWTFTMHGPDGADYPNQCAFQELVPNERIRLRHVNLPHFDLEVVLTPEGPGTRLAWTGVFENAAFAEGARAFLESANEQNLDRLAQELART